MTGSDTRTAHAVLPKGLVTGLIAGWLGLCLASAASGQTDPHAAMPSRAERSPIIEEWTASILDAGHTALGSVIEVGTGLHAMMGADPAALALGAKTAQMKLQLPSFGEDDWAIGVKYIAISRKSMWWGDLDRRFSRLSAKVIRPSLAWSNRVSQRLIIHSFWASGFGASEAELSPYGTQKLYEAKHGSGKGGDGHSFANRTMQMQSLAGFTEDRFQMSAEWERNSGDRILLSTRFERTGLEQLHTFSVRLTLAQQWSADGFNLRLGGGPQYSMLSGKDLDGEDIKAAGWLPAADFAIYWIL
jgi:hypothetical protein